VRGLPFILWRAYHNSMNDLQTSARSMTARRRAKSSLLQDVTQQHRR
jgi:hypothetical protein